MEVSDGWICARRCYEAMAGADVEVGQALWRAFGRYYWRSRDGGVERTACSTARPVARQTKGLVFAQIEEG